MDDNYEIVHFHLIDFGQDDDIVNVSVDVLTQPNDGASAQTSANNANGM